MFTCCNCAVLNMFTCSRPSPRPRKARHTPRSTSCARSAVAPIRLHYLRPCTRAENPRERQLTMHRKDEKGSRGKALRNACRHPKHLHVGGHVDLLLRDKHDKMD